MWSYVRRLGRRPRPVVAVRRRPATCSIDRARAGWNMHVIGIRCECDCTHAQSELLTPARLPLCEGDYGVRSTSTCCGRPGMACGLTWPP